MGRQFVCAYALIFCLVKQAELGAGEKALISVSGSFVQSVCFTSCSAGVPLRHRHIWYTLDITVLKVQGSGHSSKYVGHKKQ